MMMGSMSYSSSTTTTRKSGEVSDQFPAGLRVLVVDDDPTCLTILEKMLRSCRYEVTKTNRAELALAWLRENRNGFDIVISDVHMPDMDGFKLLEHIGLEMDLPVIMMSADDSKSVVMKGVTHGACDYLIKPVRIEALKNIWQHVVRKKKNKWKDIEQSSSWDEGDRERQQKQEEAVSSPGNDGSWKIYIKGTIFLMVFFVCCFLASLFVLRVIDYKGRPMEKFDLEGKESLRGKK